MVDEHLAVALAPGADSDRGHGEPAGDLGRDGGRDRFEHDREAARVLERDRVLDQLPGGHRGLALRLEAAEHRRGLGRQTDVPHDRDPRGDDRANA